MNSVLITGCNRGIGLSLIKQFISLPEPPKHIMATCRDINKATELVSLSSSSSNLKILEIDLTHFNKYDELLNKVKTITENKGLNLLINNAGISTKFTRIQMLKLDQLMENFIINTASPLMLTKTCLPLLQTAAKENQQKPVGIERAAVINISSILGSISNNTSDGGFYPYRCSKTALNAATKSLSLDLKKDGIMVVAIHPGWCKTDMGGSNAPLKVDDATAILLKTLKSLSNAHSGQFLQYDGKVIPW